MESHRKGELTEALVVAELKRREIPVSKPVGDDERYDLVAESAGGLWKLQVKTGRLKDGTIRFHGKSQHTNAAGNVYQRYDGDVDFFVVYVDELEELYLVEESSVRSNMRLRVDEPDQHDRTINGPTPSNSIGTGRRWSRTRARRKATSRSSSASKRTASPRASRTSATYRSTPWQRRPTETSTASSSSLAGS